jgi:hypothetical protein
MQDGQVLWQGTASARWPIYMGAGFVVLAVILALASGYWLFYFMAIAGPFIWALASIRVELTSTALTVQYFGGLPWPVTRIRVADIRGAKVVELKHPKGWGYRGSLRIYGRAALILRAGPSLRLQFDRGRWFLVTVSNPEGAVQVLQQLGVAPS